MRKKILWIFVLLMAGALAVYFFWKPGHSGQMKIADSGLSADSLSRKYCSLCHIYPSPELLDKATWTGSVLPNMGWRLGIRKPGEDPYANMDPDEVAIMQSRHIYPDQPLISENDWEKIRAFYSDHAPAAPRNQDSSIVSDQEWKNFSVQAVYLGKKLAPRTTLLKFDPVRSLLYIGDGDSSLSILRPNLKLLASWRVDSPPVDMGYTASGNPEILCIGSMTPSDKLQGRLYVPAAAGSSADSLVDFRQLARPVQFVQADLDGDGVRDLVLCQFGNYVGKLSWFEGSDPGKEHVLIDQPGAVHVVVQDINGDGKPDILALMAQAREELLLFMNQGGGKFRQSVIREFPPVYGSNYFELDDFNGDGHPDILMTNGDNWDLSPIRKYYHGIRILMNDGNNHFEEKYFFPLYGASKAMACDFDHDGDLDIAAIAFYDDPENPRHSFVYMENDGHMHFKETGTAAAANGKWLTMDIGDFNHDGNTDIFLGSYFQSVGEIVKLAQKGIDSYPQALLLWNHSPKRRK